MNSTPLLADSWSEGNYPPGKQVAGYYNLQGLKTSPATNGPVIVRFNDGTSRIIYHQ